MSSSKKISYSQATGGYRVAIQLDPIDTILYTALVYEAADLIEGYRIPVEKQVSCSYRVQKDATGQLFNPDTGWDDFHEKSQNLVESGAYSHVLIADITDFYNQVSHHRIENALEAAGVTPSRARSIERFLGNLTARQSRGIPVGPTGSILLAEACLSDVDTYLVREGYIHSRYVDDFRIFCDSLRKAEKALHDLSDYLYTAHRLSIQSYKTRILKVDEFTTEELLDPERLEEQSKTKKVVAMLASLKGYNDKEPSALKPEEMQKLIRENLRELFALCLEKRPLHLGLPRYLLRKAATHRTAVLQDQVIDNLQHLLPVLRDAIFYLIRTTHQKNIEAFGGRLISFLEQSSQSFVPYVRLWITHALTEKFSDALQDQVMQLCKQDNNTRYMALLARKHGYLDWVRSQKEIWNNYSPWERRAIIWSAPVLPEDERKYWLKSIENAGDKLDYIIAQAAFQK